jgi:DNA-binding transcriptional LysR family regulator
MKKHAISADLWALDMSQLRLLHLLLTEANVSAAATSLGVSQPAVSLRLARLRKLFGDPLLVRAGTGMVPTDKGRTLIEPLAAVLDAFERLSSEQTFDPALSRRHFRVAAPNYLGASLLPRFAGAVAQQAPHMRLSLQTTVPGRDYVEALASGEIDLLVGNWPDVPSHLMTQSLPEDRLVCLMCKTHPLADRARIDLETWLAQDHVSPSAKTDGRFSPVDAQLMRLHVSRHIKVVLPNYTLIPQILPGTGLILTTGARFVPFATRTAPLTAVDAPAELGPVVFRLLWHERSQSDEAHAWARRMMRDVALTLAD